MAKSGCISHWTAWCAAAHACREAFHAARLKAQVAAVREFCGSPYQGCPKPPERSVEVSEIFEFFSCDFVPAEALPLLGYINI